MTPSTGPFERSAPMQRPCHVLERSTPQTDNKPRKETELNPSFWRTNVRTSCAIFSTRKKSGGGNRLRTGKGFGSVSFLRAILSTQKHQSKPSIRIRSTSAPKIPVYRFYELLRKTPDLASGCIPRRKQVSPY